MEINALTILGDEPIKKLKTSIYSFIQTNQWFKGDLYIVVESAEEISDLDLSDLLTLYQGIKILDLHDHADLLEIVEKNADSDAIEEILKLSILLTDSQKIFYFSSSLLFLNSIDSMLSSEENSWIYSSIEEGSPNLIYFSEKIEKYSLEKFKRDFTSASDFLNLLYSEFKNNCTLTQFEGKILVASNYSDLKFIQRKNDFLNATAILFDITKDKIKKYSKINQILLHNSHSMSKLLTKPIFRRGKKLIISEVKPRSNFNLTDELYLRPADSTLKSFTKKRISPTKNRRNSSKYDAKLIKEIEIYAYLKNKKICLVANSSDLLNHEYGDFIDSHDIVIRFNGYKIIPENTGSKINIHCVFREFKEAQLVYAPYKIVISKGPVGWSRSINDFHMKDGIKNGYQIIDFNYPINLDFELAGCKNIKLPTSGLCIYLYLNRLGLSKNVTLVGFNGYNGGDPSTILRENNDDKLAPAHDYLQESFFWRNNFTEVMPGVLKIKNKK